MPATIRIPSHRVPSTGIGSELSIGVASSEGKGLDSRPPQSTCPYGFFFFGFDPPSLELSSVNASSALKGN